MNDFEKELIDVCSMNEMTKGLIPENKAHLFSELYLFMKEYNNAVNITSITEQSEVILKHIIDSVVINKYIKDNDTICDIGCGGGFPSIPNAILRENVKFLCDDSVTKKTIYVKKCSEHLGLSNIEVTNKRAEELGNDSSHRERYDIVTARGVGKLNLICELCIPLVKVGGMFIAMKSANFEEELNEASGAIETLGAEYSFKTYSLKNSNEEISRSLIIIRKTKHTPSIYPRTFSQISKKPL